jgi:hypothetical protein
VYTITHASFKREIQQAGNPTRAVPISVEAARDDNAILPDNLISKVALEVPETESSDRNIPINNNCKHEEHHSGMAGGRRDYADAGDQSNLWNAITTASR